MSKFLPPEAFTFHKSTEWPAWRARFTRFRLATEHIKKSGEVQISALIYAMGPEAEHIFQPFKFGDGEVSNNYGTVIAKFDKYLIPKRNVNHERGLFNQTVQRAGDTVEEFVRHLYEIAEHCDFSDKEDGCIRDRIVLGMADRELSERLQLRSDVTLEDTIHAARQFKLVRTQMSAQVSQGTSQNLRGVRANSSNGSAQGARHKIGKQWKKSSKQPRRQQSQKQQSNNGHCGRCGHTHPDQPCPARQAECYRCHKHGHFAQMCLRGQQKQDQPRACEVTEGDVPALFGECLSCNDAYEPAWRKKIRTQAAAIDFKLDSGAMLPSSPKPHWTDSDQRQSYGQLKTKSVSPGGLLSGSAYW